MTTTRQVSDQPLEEPQRFGLDVPVTIDVAFCDLMRSREPQHDGPYVLRIRGIRQPDGARVRAFVPLHEIEGGLLASQALLAPVNTDALSGASDSAFVAVPIVQFALTFTKRRKGNGQWWYDVAVRHGARAVDLEAYLQLLRAAADKAVPVLRERGFSVGAAEVISIADTLYAARTIRAEGTAR